MKNHDSLRNGIPISVSLSAVLKEEKFEPTKSHNHRRVLYISLLALILGFITSFIAKALIWLINFFTSVFFFGRFSGNPVSPADHHLGIFVIIIPVLGGIIVGIMAFYGSKAIRGHGIPEAMEQILTNDSRIHPSLTYLKPISSAISIGTGGPFGAEGPIIATGGALGSALGQLLRISAAERKVLLAAGATAGMSAIFGTPVAAIFLAVELLLFEFSPRSIIPVTIACVTGAAMHHILFEAGPVFPMPAISSPDGTSLLFYCLIGLLLGFVSAFVTRAVYFIEDSFEKLPIHWMWWPAIGGLVVGVAGYFVPHTLGVGYDNIAGVLSGSIPFRAVLILSVVKFISWSVSLGSGTSGGTLAPLLTIGGATGMLFGSLLLSIFPSANISLSLAALVGMSAMFAGSSRALLTSIIFAVESTGQSNAFLPLLGACILSYIISFFLTENTIMTEKIARRGVRTPNSYEPDILDKMTVGSIMNPKKEPFIININDTISELREWLKGEGNADAGFLIAVNDNEEYCGLLKLQEVYRQDIPANHPIRELLLTSGVFISDEDSLRTAAELMAKSESEILLVVSDKSPSLLTGIIASGDIISAYKTGIDEHLLQDISLRNRTVRVLLRGRKFLKKTVHSSRSKYKENK